MMLKVMACMVSLNMIITLMVMLISSVSAKPIPVPVPDECKPDEKRCEYWLEVQEQLAMVLEENKTLVKAYNGMLIPFDQDPKKQTITEIPANTTVSLDGVPRMVISVNKTIPGPPIVVYEGQELIVHVKNMLLSDSLTIHWHGLHQKGTPFMDGVGFITQCPIASGQRFTYTFKAEPKGTFWYHSHIGAQRSNGLFGALIIKERPVVNKTHPTDVIMTVGDWHHLSSEEVYNKMIYGNFEFGRRYNTTESLDGGLFSNVPWVSGLIEGKGRYTNPETGVQIKAPISWFKVQKGKVYRFRVIHFGALYPLRVSVDQHKITVVASDGYDLKPTEVESFVANPGERFDFLLTANKSVQNYWIRAVSLEHGVKDHSVKAVLHYVGASPEKEPTTDRICGTKRTECVVINCPFWYYPKDQNTRCILMSQLKSLIDHDNVPKYKEDSQEYFMNWAFPGSSKTGTPGAVNGRKFEFPGVNSLTQDDELGDYACDEDKCGKDKICYCHYQINIPFDKTIQMVWLNMGVGAGWGHPIHLHGHSFYVLKMAYANQNNTTGKLLNTTRLNHPDVDCNDTLNYCNKAKWTNGSWENGKIPGLNLVDPPRKDTLIIPTGGYAVIRIRSNNPGKWFAHCHIEVHALNGMAMVVSEALDRANKPPKGFPACSSFYNDNRRNRNYTVEGDCKHYHIYKNGTIAFGTISGILLLFIIVLLVKSRVKSCTA